MANKLLSTDSDMIERMENDLRQKIAQAFANVPDLSISTYGIFSLDDLESKMEADLYGGIGIGASYLGAQGPDKPGANLNIDRGLAAKTVAFSFLIVLAVPTEEQCGTRHNATKLLTILRQGILGSAVDSDRTQRTWCFVSERPEVSASSKTMLYYSQVWQLTMQSLGNTQQ